MPEAEMSYEQREKKRYKEIKELFEDLLSNHLNCCEREVVEVFSKEIHRNHRTLQANFWRMIQKVAIDYAETSDAYFDPRNKTAHEFCKEIAKIEIGIPLI